jgi:hypothetical protein
MGTFYFFVRRLVSQPRRCAGISAEARLSKKHFKQQCSHEANLAVLADADRSS